MFERIEIRELKQDSTGSLDLGFLVEAMLFYGQVEVVAHDNPIKQLITSCGPEPLIELLERIGVDFHLAEVRGALEDILRLGSANIPDLWLSDEEMLEKGLVEG